MTATPVPGPEGAIEISDPGRLAPDPVVSVVMLAYNHAEHLARAMESVLRQRAGFQFELLVGEDCSTDGSRAIAEDVLREHPEAVRIITSERNVGAYRNCMRLFAAARGEFIAQLDGDDYWFPGKLSLQLDALRSARDAIAVYSNAIVVDRGKCEGKGDCVEVCPYGVFEVRRIDDADFAQLGLLGKLRSVAHGKKTAYTPKFDACRACGMCVVACPEKALRLVAPA